MERMQAKARARFAFSEFLGRSGKRCTPERLHILDIAMEQRKPFTAEQLLQRCRNNEGINVCRATLFNTLPMIVDAGFMRKIVHDKVVQYESIRPGAVSKPRLYMVCSQCGKVHKSDAPTLEHWLIDINMRGFLPKTDSAVIYINGLCSRCRRNSKNKIFN
ncbi:MAG: transcriptional repressor [Bacteroides sp.]|nr:transcriptional repressor [Bacteroides sp.]MCM1378689.1 transcriptional repressor [Bacteroides sp.]MCM1444962.1 transcriptional repressor [Prevotella sp.]